MEEPAMPRFDPDRLDVQYNARAAVPDHPQVFTRWASESAQARERFSRRLDIAYGETPPQTLDVFPSPRADAPVLVFIHGGWWRSLDKRDHSFVAPAFVRAGAMVVVPNYALCPAATIEEIALQMTRALAWTWHHAALYGGDRRRIVVAGHSAGGHLAAMLLCCDWKKVDARLPRTLLRGVLAVSGVFDLEPLRHAPFLQRDLRLTPASVRRLSPLRFAPPAGPLHLAVGERESEAFRRQSRAMQRAWGERVVPSCETVPGADHFRAVEALARPGSALHARALGLLGLDAAARTPAGTSAG
jgi:arylformamidase